MTKSLQASISKATLETLITCLNYTLWDSFHLLMELLSAISDFDPILLQLEASPRSMLLQCL